MTLAGLQRNFQRMVNLGVSSTDWRVVLATFAACLLFASQAEARFSRVIIDPGHGGAAKGGSYGYVYEKHLALDTARRLAVMLEQVGLKVTMTRTRDKFLELEQRSKLGNRYRDAIFVSIHYNWTSRSSVAGGETFYHHASGKPLAAAIQKHMCRSASIYNRGVKYGGFHVIRRTTKNPAVLVECGFVSNSWERQKCMTGSHRQKLAEGILKGILEYRWNAR